MFNKPEELIMAILFAIWVGLTYVLAAYTGVGISTILWVTGSTAVWAVAVFWLWRVGKLNAMTYPLGLGAWVACWWCWFNGWAMRGGADPAALPWYTAWWFKLLLSAVPTVLGYFYEWRKAQKPTFR